MCPALLLDKQLDDLGTYIQSGICESYLKKTMIFFFLTLTSTKYLTMLGLLDKKCVFFWSDVSVRSITEVLFNI